MRLFSQAVVAIDGSKFKAVNNRERNFTPGKIERRERELEESIQRYLDALETADRTRPVEMQAKTERLQGKIQKMPQRLHDLQSIKAQLEVVPDRQADSTRQTSSTSLVPTSTNALLVNGRSTASAAKRLDCRSASIGPVPALAVR